MAVRAGVALALLVAAAAVWWTLGRGPGAPEEVGAGWFVRDGRFVSVVHGFVVEPPAGWTLVPRRELATLRDDAHVGLASADAFLLVVGEPGDGVDLEGVQRAVTAALTAAGGVAGGSVEVPFLGSPARLDGYRAGGRVAFAGYVRRGERLYQLLAEHPEGARPDLAAAFGAFRADRPEPPERALVAPDAEGPGWSLRGGVFEDAGRGLTWRVPAGAWAISRATDGVRAIHPGLGVDATLTAAETRAAPCAREELRDPGGPRVRIDCPLDGARLVVRGFVAHHPEASVDALKAGLQKR